eukprot:SAG11_NODE_11564_length_752_cov_1.375191_1_plen_102_part_00
MTLTVKFDADGTYAKGPICESSDIRPGYEADNGYTELLRTAKVGWDDPALMLDPHTVPIFYVRHGSRKKSYWLVPPDQLEQFREKHNRWLDTKPTTRILKV